MSGQKKASWLPLLKMLLCATDNAPYCSSPISFYLDSLSCSEYFIFKITSHLYTRRVLTERKLCKKSLGLNGAERQQAITT